MAKKKKRELDRWIFQIPLSDIQEEGYKRTSEKQCICCDRKISRVRYQVHLLDNGNLVSTLESMDNTDGFYLIGSSCKMNLPNNFYFEAI